MDYKEKILNEMQTLILEADHMKMLDDGYLSEADPYQWESWTHKTLNLLRYTFGENSDSYVYLKRIIDSQCRYQVEIQRVKGVLYATLDSYKKGFNVPNLSEIENMIPQIIKILNTDNDIDESTKNYAISQVNILDQELKKENKAMPVIKNIVSFLSEIATIASFLAGMK